METEIVEFNKKLVEEDTKLKIIEYIKLINEKFYNIDISFIDEFINYVNKNDFCIGNDVLLKYNIINTNNSNDILTLLKQYEFIEESDYITVRNVPHDSLSLFQKITYMLSPKAFKFCLIRSKNTKRFAHYYLLLEEGITHYNQYQILQLEHKIKDICVDRVLKLENEEKSECFVLARNNMFKSHPYFVIRGQIRNYKRNLRENKCLEEDVILNIPCCYANNLYNKIKEKLTGHIEFQKRFLLYDEAGELKQASFDINEMKDGIDYVSITRHIGLVNITLEDFVENIKDINDERYIV